MTLLAGTTLGRYQILVPLGSGGMATVYKAYEPSLDRTVALKVIRPGLAEEEGFLARFRREAQSVARLQHPNIVQVFAFDESEGRYYLAMQFLEGGTLKDRIEALAPGTLLPPAEVASIISQVADALGYAHEQGVVHRDIKPSNVMLTARGRAVVTDFGIAKIASGTALTQTGVGIGTPEYMAPEQGAGAKVDARADIYALGVVAYELLAGRVPYLADTPFAVVAAHMRDPLPLPSALNPAVPAGAERALLKALAKDPAQRFATATEFAAALSDGLRGAPAGVTSATILPAAAAAKPDTRSFTFSLPALPRSRPALAAIAAAVLVMIGSTGAVISGAFKGSRVEAPAAASPLTAVPAAPAVAASASLAAKGRLVWQAKLDGTDIDVRGASSPFIGGDASSADVRFVPGAIEFVQNKPIGGRNILLNSPARDAFVLEVDVDARAAGQFGIGWWQTGRDPQYVLNIDTKQGRMEFQYYHSGVTTQPLSPSTPAPEVVSGKPFSATLVVARDRFTAFANQRQVVDAVADGRISPAALPLRVYFGGDPGTLRLTGLRLYELQAPAAGVAAPVPSAAAAPGGPPKFAAPAKGALIADMPLNATLFRNTGQGPTANRGEIRFTSGAAEFSAAQPQSGIFGDISRLLPDGDRYIVELDLAVTPGSDVTFAYVVRQYAFQSDAQKIYGSFALTVGVNTFAEGLQVSARPPERIDVPSAAVAGIVDLQKGRAFTVAIVVEHPRYTVFLDQKQVGRFTTNGDVGTGTRATLSLNGGPGTITLTGVRYYALP